MRWCCFYFGFAKMPKGCSLVYAHGVPQRFAVILLRPSITSIRMASSERVPVDVWARMSMGTTNASSTTLTSERSGGGDVAQQRLRTHANGLGANTPIRE